MGGVCGVLTSDGNCEIQTDAGSSAALPTNRPSDEVKINSSVGISAMNMSDDVFAIQYALNKVPPIDGGPSPQIKMDGKCDQQTIKTIQNFQQKHFACEFLLPEWDDAFVMYRAFILYLFVLAFIIPVILISVFYTLVVVRLRRVGPNKQTTNKKR